MMKLARICAALVLTLPLAASALTSVTTSDSYSGGTVSSGHAVVTGDSSADAQVETHIGSGSTSKTIISTEVDGVVHTQVIEKPASPKAPKASSNSIVTAKANTEVSATVASSTVHANIFVNFWLRIKSFFHFF